MELIIALDYSSKSEAEDLLKKIPTDQVILKIGYELFIHAGPAWVKMHTQMGRRVFLDLKLHDIPNTVAKGISNISELGVEMTTLHLSGGVPMLEKAKNEAKVQDRPLKLLGVSVLTSMEQNCWNVLQTAQSRSESKILDSVEGLARLGAPYVDGIVCSAVEVQKIKAIQSSLYTVVPGIRPKGFDSQDQKRVSSPEQAKEFGADAIVVGRPITQSSQPTKVVEEILNVC